jgi:hypothetical protein
MGANAFGSGASMRWLMLALMLAWPAVASAQLDPLLMIKRNKPNVIFAVDTSLRMQRDADNVYYDPNDYTRGGTLLNPWEASLGIGDSNTLVKYRRKYIGLTPITGSGERFSATRIDIHGDLMSGYTTFFAKTRLAVARVALAQALTDNTGVARFGLIKTRQSNPAWGTAKNMQPVKVSEPSQQTLTETGSFEKWAITHPTVSQTNGSVTSVQSPVVSLTDTSNATVLSKLNLGVNAAGLIPSGEENAATVDTPIDYLLKDAQSHASSLIGGDGTTNCRNTVVVLVVGGGEGNSDSGANPENTATAFKSFSASPNRRVPIYVIAIAPPSSDVSELQAIAANSGGQYFEITKAMIDQTTAGQPVPELVRAANTAIQHAFVDFADCNTAPTTAKPFGPQTEFQITSPVVGTVLLKGATDINGSLLDDDETEILKPSTTTVVPQNSNVILTTAFALPSFEGKLRAARLYKPVLDSTKPSGWRFEKDGTKLWVGSVPAAASRNIYTVTQSGTMTAFTTANVATLAAYMNTTEAMATRIIDYVRSLPLGAFVGSTPAFMDPPSIEPAPDVDYPGYKTANANRRTLIWIGANDGMMHALDARTGVEVFAFIPFNLLPKLRALLDGQAVGNFDFYVDSSPKVADVRVSNTVATCPVSLTTCWRTYLFFGQGPGGTFYNALDVTLDDMSPSVTPTGALSDVLTYFSNASRVKFRWSFPSNMDFDYTLAPYGDIKSTASALAKSVGETWSDPAVGQVLNESGKYALLTGSGFITKTKQDQSNRGGVVGGTTFYLINIDDGTVFDSESVGSDGVAESVDNCVTANNCGQFKNALQADVVATGPPDTRFVTKAYVGDLDGNVWRFDITMQSGLPAVTAKTKLHAAGAAHPLFASMATVHIGATQSYVFFGTGSDLLPSTGLPTTHQYKLISLLDQGSSGSVKFTELLQKIDGAGNDEKVTGFPAVAGDIVFFVTAITKPANACTLPDGALFAMTFTGGKGYTATGTNSGNAILTLTGGRASAPFIVDQHVAFAFGNKLEILGDPNDFNNGVGQVGVRILNWRDVR